MLKLPIYMDNNATTPLDPRVLDAMMPYLTTEFGNAASRSHAFGWKAEEAVQKAREQIAGLIGGNEEEVVFTSGATESDNLAIKGVAEFYREKGNHIVTTRTEHKAVLDTCKRLERQGFEVTYLEVDKQGRVSPEQVRKAITGKTILVSIMWANNEIGTVQPIAEIGAVVKERGVLFHSDAVQGIGKLPFDVEQMKVDLVSISAHKFYGPKGIGALWVRRKPRVRIAPISDGGDRAARDGRGGAAHRQAAAQAAGLPLQPPRPPGAQRPPRAPPAGQPERQLRLRGGRGAHDGHQERGCVLGVRLHQRVARAVLRAARLWGERGPGAYLHPVRGRPLQHRARSGFRGQVRRRPGEQAAGHEPPLRDGQGRDRPLEDRVGGPLNVRLGIECGLDASKLLDFGV